MADISQQSSPSVPITQPDPQPLPWCNLHLPLEKTLTAIQTKLDSINKHLGTINTKVDNIADKVNELDKKIAILESKTKGNVGHIMMYIWAWIIGLASILSMLFDIMVPTVDIPCWAGLPIWLWMMILVGGIFGGLSIPKIIYSFVNKKNKSNIGNDKESGDNGNSQLPC